MLIKEELSPWQNPIELEPKQSDTAISFDYNRENNQEAIVKLLSHPMGSMTWNQKADLQGYKHRITPSKMQIMHNIRPNKANNQFLLPIQGNAT